MIILFIVAYLCVNFLTLKYNLHIFQLNYYTPATQMKWTLKNSKKFLIILLLNILSITSIMLLKQLGMMISIILLLINLLLVIERNVKKKIVYTNRVIRLFITNYLILVILSAILYQYQTAWFTVILVVNAFMPIYMILINYINQPINHLINKYYVNDAKKILRNMPNLKIVAITGSYGKTSTKNYLTKILSSKYHVLCTPGNFNTLLGITRTIRTQLKPTHEVFVCEIGIDRVGEMEKIIDLVKSDYCMITAIGPQHLETFKTQENIIKSKLKLIDGLKPGGIAFLNLDNQYLKNSKIEKDYIGYGIENNTNNDLTITDVTYNAKGLGFEITEKGEKYTFSSKLLGDHNLINLFGAITVARYMGVPMKEIMNSVKHIQSVEHRLNLIPGDQYHIIDDSYNSNPIGASNALRVLRAMEGIRILITPGMVELGEKQYEYNYQFGTLASKCADDIILVNEKQTKPIQDALEKANYPKDNTFIVDTFNSGMKIATEIDNKGKSKYILIENDLPDNY